MLRALALVLALGLQDGLDQKIEKILQRLSADDIDARESAVRDLSALGPDALPALRARAGGLEGEARGRVEEACRRIERERIRAGVLPPLRLVTLEAKDRPAKDVLEDIARQAGVAIEFGGAAPETPVTLSLKDAPPFRAFDEACRRAGDFSFEPMRGRSEDVDEDFAAALGPEGAKGDRVLVQGVAAPDYPAAFVRHYRVRVTQVTVTRQLDFRQNRSSAHLQLDLQWLPGVSPLALSRFVVEEVLDDQGRSLMPDKPDDRLAFGRRPARMGHFGTRSAGYPHTLSIPVPPADAKKIATLRGTAAFAFPGETRALVFDKPLEGGKTLELGGLKATLKDVRAADGTLTVTLEVAGRFAPPRGGGDPDDGAFTHEDVQVLTESGKRLRSRGMSGRGDGQTMTWTLRYTLPAAEALKEIRIPCVLDRFEDELKFEIRDIPLPR
ncbi:MAG TPA: hypothetical protein VF950_05095 [Planctomycetota bacterium]